MEQMIYFFDFFLVDFEAPTHFVHPIPVFSRYQLLDPSEKMAQNETFMEFLRTADKALKVRSVAASDTP
jgi:hypothetical protein